MGRRTPWNVNISDDARLEAAVPRTARSALDVGCGDGFLAARLARRVPRVVAIDLDAPVLERARRRFPDAPVEWRLGDVLELRAADERFDAVVSNATLHHLPDTRLAVRALGRLVAPGGVLAIGAFARFEWRELPWQVVAWVVRGVAIRVHGKWEHSAPIAWPPREGFRTLRRIVRDELPGARVLRTRYGRVRIVWRAPAPPVVDGRRG